MRRIVLGIWALTLACGSAFAASPVSVTILHTNDLHAHFRPQNTPLQLGGIARIKTLVDRLKAKVPNPIFVDAGDWSEGAIYYTQNGGSEILKMMDLMGYDITVVGNHDWLNGPDSLLDAIETANPHFSMIVANFDTSDYPRKAEWNRRIQPYVIRNFNGAKIAFIGLATYEFIYDKYIAPIRIEEPFSITNQLAHELKKQVDAVVVISHNRIAYNQALLKAAPDVDLVIGAHDHVKLTKPIVVDRDGAQPGWLVETGCYGEYLGRVDMQITPRTASSPSQVKLLNYGLTQIDRSIPDDPVIDAHLSQLEAAIQERAGPIFSDHIADSNVELTRDQNESRMGNFTADAYRAATGADVALDMKYFVYGEIHKGPINTVDMFNANPAIYDFRTGKSWTLKTLPMSGGTLSWIINSLMFRDLPLSDTLYMSGISVLFNGTPKPPIGISLEGDPNSSLYPILSGQEVLEPMDDGSTVEQILIDGQPLQTDKTYLMVGGGGIFEGIEALDDVIPGLIPLDGAKDTGIESWRAMDNYARVLSPISNSEVPVGDRLETVQPNLGLYYDDVSWTPLYVNGTTVTARISVTVHNYGDSPSQDATQGPGPYLMLAQNDNGIDLSKEAVYKPLAPSIPLASIAPGGARTYNINVQLKPEAGIYSLTAIVLGNPDESDHSNDLVIRYFNPPQTVGQTP